MEDGDSSLHSNLLQMRLQGRHRSQTPSPCEKQPYSNPRPEGLKAALKITYNSSTTPVYESKLLYANCFIIAGFPVAQMVEHGASNANIMGSIPRESKSWSNVKL